MYKGRPPEGGRGGFKIVDENGHGGRGGSGRMDVHFPGPSKISLCLTHLKNQIGAVTIAGCELLPLPCVHGQSEQCRHGNTTFFSNFQAELTKRIATRNYVPHENFTQLKKVLLVSGGE